MNLVLRSKHHRKMPKMYKTKTVRKTRYIWHSLCKGSHLAQEFADSLKRRCFCDFLIVLYFSMQKDCQ